ncbi:MAG TPA: hypothetical protein VGD36_17120, partial [Xanthobacteraceae bacterium]
MTFLVLTTGEFAGRRGAGDGLRAGLFGKRAEQPWIIVLRRCKKNDRVGRGSLEGLPDGLAELGAGVRAVPGIRDGRYGLVHGNWQNGG